jgi:hypothetical protein
MFIFILHITTYLPHIILIYDDYDYKKIYRTMR